MAMSQPKPGPQQPQKYPFVTDKYRKFGEQPGFIYDPYNDRYQPDPKQAKKYYEDSGLVEAEKKPPGLADAIMPVLGTSAAIGVGQSLGKDGGAGLLSGLKETVSGASDLFGTAADKVSSGANFVKDTFGFGGGTDAGMQATQQAMGTGGEALASNGSGLIADATEASNQAYNAAGDAATNAAAAPSALSQGLGAAGAAYGTYQALQGVKEGDPMQAGMGGAGAWVGLNAMGMTLGPAGWAMIAAPVALSLVSKYFDKPSIIEQTKERWGKLSKSEDPATAAYAQQYQSYLDSDQQKADAGIDFDEAKKQGLKPEQVWGGYGMFDTYGSDWLNKYSEEQRRQISQRLIDADLVDSRKGDIVLTDKEKAKKIAEEVFTGQVAPATTDPTQAGLLAGGSAQPQAAAPVPVTQGSAPAAANAGLLAGGVRPLGFDEDPNNPGKFIRRK